MVKKYYTFSPVETAACILAAVFYIASAAGYIRMPPLHTLAVEKNATHVSGVIAGNPVKSGSYYKMNLALSSITTEEAIYSAQGEATLSVSQPLVEALYPGKLYSQSASLLSKKANTASVSQDERIPLFEKGLQIENIPVSFRPNTFIKNNMKAEFNVRTSGDLTWQWKSPLDSIRALLRLQLKRTLYQWGDAGGLLLALISSSREYIPKDISNAFTRAGLAHILALSGMHLSILASLAIRIGGGIGGKKGAVRLSVSALCVFVWFAGSSPSLLRALLFSLILITAGSLGLQARQLPALALAFIIQTFLFPIDAQSISFLLSYAALFGILTVSPYCTGILKTLVPVKLWTNAKIKKPLNVLLSSIGASMGAQLATLAITVSTFGAIMPIGIIASVIVSPLISIFLLAGIILLALILLVPFLNVAAAYVMQGLYILICSIVRFFARVPPILAENQKISTLCISVSIICIGYILVRTVFFDTQRGKLYVAFTQL